MKGTREFPFGQLVRSLELRIILLLLVLFSAQCNLARANAEKSTVPVFSHRH